MTSKTKTSVLKLQTFYHIRVEIWHKGRCTCQFETTSCQFAFSDSMSDVSDLKMAAILDGYQKQRACTQFGNRFTGPICLPFVPDFNSFYQEVKNALLFE